MARSEFMNAKLAADQRSFPAAYETFTTRLPSTAKVETHTYMTNLPRLREFRDYSASVRLLDKAYTVANKTYRIGPVQVSKDDLEDDQIGGYLKSIQDLPNRAEKDAGHIMLAHLAAGTSNTCFDGTAFFANSHTFGTGDNLDTFDGSANDGATHKIIAMIADGPIKPLIYQDRESLSGLLTDADTPQALKLRQFEYWSDMRFGKGYGFWWDAIHMTITDTPTVAEVYTIVRQIINLFRTFKLPKGRDSDDELYVHEQWEPTASNFVLVCNLSLKELVDTAVRITQYVTSTGNVDNVYKDKATVLASSALGA